MKWSNLKKDRFARRSTDILFYISVALFIGGISLGFLGRAICTRSNDNYKENQPESFVPDTIETVLRDDDLKQIYVCYNDANCVNVYTEDGAFLWCVATPYMRYSYFELQDDKLIIYDGDAYVYDARSGEFLGLENEENLELDYDWEKYPVGQLAEGDYCFDSFQVYRMMSDGTLKVIVQRPWWHYIFSHVLCLCVVVLGAAGFGISIFLEKITDYMSAKKTAAFENKKARLIRNYLKITGIVHLVYAALNIGLAFFTAWLIIGIIPLTVHMIVSSIILSIMSARLLCDTNERAVLDFWEITEIGSFIIAFISVIISSSIAG